MPQRNGARWRTLDGPYPDQRSFEQDIAQMKEWVAARVKWLDKAIAGRAIESKDGVTDSVASIKLPGPHARC